MMENHPTVAATKFAKAACVLASALALIMAAVCICKFASTPTPSLRQQFSWNTVPENDPWYPAMSHPDANAIINSVLHDWLGRVEEQMTAEFRIYEDVPNLDRVRLLRFQLPNGFVSTVEGVTFSLQDQISDNRDDSLMGNEQGEFGIRFDWFEKQADNSIKFRCCLLQYADRRRIGGYALFYRVTKIGDDWVATLEFVFA